MEEKTVEDWEFYRRDQLMAEKAVNQVKQKIIDLIEAGDP